MSNSRQNSSIFLSLLVRFLECRIWNPWRSKTELNLEEFHYKVIGPVGKGVFNNVYRCCQRHTDRVVAIKEIVTSDENGPARGSLDRKISFLERLTHENVVRVVQFTFDLNVELKPERKLDKLLSAFSRGKDVYLAYEYFTPDLSYFISLPNNRKNPLQRNYFLYQILSAVAYYHSQGFLHRDLKPQNLLIDYSAHLIKLADFDLATAFEDPDAYYDVATSQYSAPELLLGFGQYSTAADMWSVGCIFGEMLTGQAVFHGISQEDQLKAIFGLLGTPTEDSWPEVTALCSSLYSFPKFEPMDLAVKFPGLEPEGLDLLSKMLCLDPNKRISAEDALNHAYIINVPKLVHRVNQRKFERLGRSGT